MKKIKRDKTTFIILSLKQVNVNYRVDLLWVIWVLYQGGIFEEWGKIDGQIRL